jgi:TorA maturation chaperone TorD
MWIVDCGNKMVKKQLECEEQKSEEMTRKEKEQFCSLAAALLVEPDAALVDDLLQKGLRPRLEAYIHQWGDNSILLSALFPEEDDKLFVQTLQEEYGRLFSNQEGNRISLVESTYKPWTRDKSCGMAFAASKGLVMGDPAIHMLDIYSKLSLEVPAALRSMPDHLVLELELLVLLYRSASQESIGGFIEGHLDWIQDLKGEVEKADPHPFYRTAVDLIHSFLQHETINTKGINHGEKRIH